MTISYTGDICSTRYWSFLRVILRWRGSIWKSVLTELFIWLCLYYAVMFIFHRALNEEGKKTFAFMAHYTGQTADYIPLTFMLGFFVKIVVERWNHMFANIGFVDSVAHMVTTIIRGNDSETTIARRNIMRYLCLIQMLILRDISVKVRKHFPNMDSVMKAGLIQEHELRLLNEMSQCGGQYGRYWIPHNWICQLCYRMRESGRIASDPLLNLLLREVKEYRERLQKLINFDLVPIPLAYPQVVFVAVRTYFLICLFSRQHFQIVEADSSNRELLIPIMTILQFIFYMGWVKVAEALLNPLGEDDDDFETLYVIERNIAISLLLADQCHAQIPEQRMDALDENNAGTIIPNGKKDVNALIGSAVRMMPKKSKSDESFIANVENANDMENIRWKKFRNRFIKRSMKQGDQEKNLKSAPAAEDGFE